MPMIELTLPVGVLAPEARRKLQQSLVRTLLKWEGAPDTPFFRAQSWSQVTEVDGDAFAALEDDLPRFRVDVTVPEGAVSPDDKMGLVKEVTADVLAAAGIAYTDALRVWVLIHDQAEGTWGAAGNIIKYQDLAALAQQHAQA